MILFTWGRVVPSLLTVRLSVSMSLLLTVVSLGASATCTVLLLCPLVRCWCVLLTRTRCTVCIIRSIRRVWLDGVARLESPRQVLRISVAVDSARLVRCDSLCRVTVPSLWHVDLKLMGVGELTEPWWNECLG